MTTTTIWRHEPGSGTGLGPGVLQIGHQVPRQGQPLPVGCAVTSWIRTRRVTCSTVKNTYSRFRVMVSTWNRSPATIPSAWALRNCCQVGQVVSTIRSALASSPVRACHRRMSPCPYAVTHAGGITPSTACGSGPTRLRPWLRP